MMNKSLLLGLLTLSASAQAVELTPSVGVAVPTGTDAFDPGFAMGLSVGGYVHPMISLEGRLDASVLNPANDKVGEDSTFTAAMISFAPLLHLTPKGPLDVQVGPLVGMFQVRGVADDSDLDVEATVTGFHVGGQLGALYRLSPTFKLGPTVAYSRMWATETCLKLDGSEICDSDPDSGDDGYFSATLAATFSL